MQFGTAGSKFFLKHGAKADQGAAREEEGGVREADVAAGSGSDDGGGIMSNVAVNLGEGLRVQFGTAGSKFFLFLLSFLISGASQLLLQGTLIIRAFAHGHPLY